MTVLLIPFGSLTKVFAKEEGVIDTIDVGDNPFGITYNSGNGYIYAVNQNSDTVSVIDENNNVIENIDVGSGSTL